MKCRLHKVEDCEICKVAGYYLPVEGPVIAGRRVPVRVPVVYDNICGVWRLTPETFFEYEPEDSVLRACHELGADAISVGWEVEVQHELDVQPNRPEDFSYLRHGRSDRRDRAKNMRISGIPKLGMREAFIDACMRVKLTGDPVYDFVQSEPGVRYRRLFRTRFAHLNRSGRTSRTHAPGSTRVSPLARDAPSGNPTSARIGSTRSRGRPRSEPASS